MITQYVHHGREVKVQRHLIGKHREHCLCHQDCKKFNPDSREDNCQIAQMVFDICTEYHVTLPVWECPEYEKK